MNLIHMFFTSYSQERRGALKRIESSVCDASGRPQVIMSPVTAIVRQTFLTFPDRTFACPGMSLKIGQNRNMQKAPVFTGLPRNLVQLHEINTYLPPGERRNRGSASRCARCRRILNFSAPRNAARFSRLLLCLEKPGHSSTRRAVVPPPAFWSGSSCPCPYRPAPMSLSCPESTGALPIHERRSGSV